ncbi:MAG: helix-turn-helix domain-containing protein [Devosia sp.]
MWIEAPRIVIKRRCCENRNNDATLTTADQTTILEHRDGCCDFHTTLCKQGGNYMNGNATFPRLGEIAAPVPCPCCSRSLAAPTFDQVVFHLGVKSQESKILGALWQGKGLPVSTEQIFTAMYEDDRDGGPGPAKMYRAFQESLSRLRKRLDGSGITIENVIYRGGYRVVIREVAP